MPSFTLRVRDFRVHQRLDWSPEGVCILAGANGAGKTTTLDALRFLRAFYFGGEETGFRAVDGVAFRRCSADPDASVDFTLEVGDVVWRLCFPMSAQGVRGTYGEEILHAGAVVGRAAMYQEGWLLRGEPHTRDDQRCCAKVLWDREEPQWMKPLHALLDGIRVYQTYCLNQVRRLRPTSPGDSFLHGSGRNLWSVLANWKGAPLRYRGQFDWVLAGARRAFPEVIGSIEFDRDLPYLFPVGATDAADGLPPDRAADGVLTGLLHLTAVAGARPGSLITFDEVENQLHPHAIRSLIAAMRRQADERNLTIVLTTHSPVVLNQFRDEPEQVFVLGHGEHDLDSPARMTDLHTEEWLAQARLGSLYEQLAFAAPMLARVGSE